MFDWTLKISVHFKRRDDRDKIYNLHRLDFTRVYYWSCGLEKRLE